MLNFKKDLFCHEYIKDRNGTQAAIRAGYSGKTAQEQASRLLSNVMVRSKINELIKEYIDALKIDIRYVLKGILKRAEVNIADAYDEDGTLKALEDMPEHLQRAILKIKTEEIYESNGRGKDRTHIGTAKTIEIESALKALELLGRHLKMFTDVHEIPGLENLAEQIKAARKRAENCRTLGK
jgi:phage terminase small subunit